MKLAGAESLDNKTTNATQRRRKGKPRCEKPDETYEEILCSLEEVLPLVLPHVLHLRAKALESVAHHAVFSTIVDRILNKDGPLVLGFVDGILLVLLLGSFMVFSMFTHDQRPVPLTLLRLVFICNLYNLPRNLFAVYSMSNLRLLRVFVKSFWFW